MGFNSGFKGLKPPCLKLFDLSGTMCRRISTDTVRFGLELCTFVKIQAVFCAKSIEALNIRVTT